MQRQLARKAALCVCTNPGSKHIMWVNISAGEAVGAVGGFLWVLHSSSNYTLLSQQLTLVSCGNNGTRQRCGGFFSPTTPNLSLLKCHCLSHGRSLVQLIVNVLVDVQRSVVEGSFPKRACGLSAACLPGNSLCGMGGHYSKQ